MTVTSGGKMKWTPGPWERATGSMPRDPEGHAIVAQNQIIARVEYFIRENNPSLANAKLIAKAPESTEKLREFYEAAKSWHSVHGHDKNSVQCDEFCRLMTEAERILREAGAL